MYHPVWVIIVAAYAKQAQTYQEPPSSLDCDYDITHNTLRSIYIGVRQYNVDVRKFRGSTVR